MIQTQTKTLETLQKEFTDMEADRRTKNMTLAILDKAAVWGKGK